MRVDAGFEPALAELVDDRFAALVRSTLGDLGSGAWLVGLVRVVDDGVDVMVTGPGGLIVVRRDPDGVAQAARVPAVMIRHLGWLEVPAGPVGDRDSPPWPVQVQVHTSTRVGWPWSAAVSDAAAVVAAAAPGETVSWLLRAPDAASGELLKRFAAHIPTVAVGSGVGL